MDRKYRKLPPMKDNIINQNYDFSQIKNNLKKIDDFMLGDEFTSLFKQIDKDKDGYISINDLKETILKKNLIK